MINKHKIDKIFLSENHIKNPTRLFIITLLISILIVTSILYYTL